MVINMIVYHGSTGVVKNKSTVNIYQMNDDLDEFLVKSFDEDLMKWINFVCRCRDGKKDYLKYDLIFGKAADI